MSAGLGLFQFFDFEYLGIKREAMESLPQSQHEGKTDLEDTGTFAAAVASIAVDVVAVTSIVDVKSTVAGTHSVCCDMREVEFGKASS